MLCLLSEQLTYDLPMAMDSIEAVLVTVGVMLKHALIKAGRWLKDSHFLLQKLTLI